MIVVDVNVLLYAYNRSALQHARAWSWWEASLSGPTPVLLSWLTLLAFLRLATNLNVFKEPFTTPEAIARVDEWLEHDCVHVIAPGERFWGLFRSLLIGAQATGNLMNDAYLAALALERGAAVCTTDRDFSRFQGLRVINPLEPSA